MNLFDVLNNAPVKLDKISSELEALHFMIKTQWVLIVVAHVVEIIIIALIAVAIYLIRNKKAMAFLKGLFDSYQSKKA